MKKIRIRDVINKYFCSECRRITLETGEFDCLCNKDRTITNQYLRWKSFTSSEIELLIKE